MNNKLSIHNIVDRIDNNFVVKCKDNSNNISKFDSFFKFSPLLDPVKFMVGKYKHLSNDILCSLPKIKKVYVVKKY